MKKILTSVAVLGFVGALAVGGTGAFFSDSETSSNNVLTAGAIDLKVDNESYYNGVLSKDTTWEVATDLTDHLFFDFHDLKPGDWGEDTISLHVDNNDSYACAYVTKTADDENLPLVGPEEEDGDDPNSEEGELDDQLYFLWWADDGDNVLEDDETIINEGYFGAAPVDKEMTVVLADSNQNVWGEEGALPGGSTRYIGKAWCYGDITVSAVPAGEGTSPEDDPGFTCSGVSVDNKSQTDTTMLDVRFEAVQSRHNDEFVCNGEPVNPGGPEITVREGGADMVETVGGRFRSFGNTGGDELYVGLHDLGVAANRVAQGYTWASGETPIVVGYDEVQDEVYGKVNGNDVVVRTADPDACPVANWDTMQISVVNRDEGTTVNLNDTEIDGYALGDFVGSGWNSWTVTGYNFGGGFELTGNIELDGTFGTSQEFSKVEVLVGCSTI